jgi:hypothetical protein
MMIESLYFSGTKTATTMISFLRAHKRVITFSLVAFGAFWLAPSWSEVGPFGFLFFFALFVMLIVSQIFWVGRVVDLGERFIPGKPRRAWLTAIASVVCLFFFAYNIGLYISPWKIPRGDSTHLTLRHVLFEAPFLVVVCGVVGRLRPGDGFLDGRPSRARRSVGLRQSAQGCGRPRRHAHAWCDST